MTAESKIRLLAMQDATLQSYFGKQPGLFRFFDKQLQPGYLKVGQTCARSNLLSTVYLHSHETDRAVSQLNLTQLRFQIDVLDFDSERARAAASAIIDWLYTVSFAVNDQFASPPTSPKSHPNQVLNRREGMEPMPQPAAHVVMLDVRVFNLET